MSGIGGYARVEPQRAALVAFGRTVTFGELDERQRRLAGALAHRDVERGDRIAVLAANRHGVIEVAAGALRAGVLPVMINPLLTRAEAAYLLEDSGARVLFTDRTEEPPAPVENVVTFGDAYERALEGAVAADLPDHVSTRPMHYTSGTTGRPKGVFVPPEPEDVAAERSRRFQALWELSTDDLHLVCSPLAHSAPLRFAIRTLEAGGAVLVQERFDAEQTVASIELFGVTSMFLVPTHLERILRLGPHALARYDISSLRLVGHAGAPISEDTKRRVLDLLPFGSVWEFYGSTEGQATRISTDEWLRKPGSVGRAIPGASIAIADEEGAPLPAREVGEVWICDPGADRFVYWGDDAKTAAAWRGDSFTAGDLGWLDEDGYLFLAGRKDDTIITGGVNVYPTEVEDALARHPQVSAVVVYGAPSEEWGQEVRASVVAGPGLTTDELRAWAREHLAPFKVPKVIELVDELPITPTGKVKRGAPS